MIPAVKLYVITKRTIITAALAVVGIGLIVLAVVLFGGLPASAPAEDDAAQTVAVSQGIWPYVEAYELEVVAAHRRQLPIYNVGRDDNKIALTVDAAWEDKSTLALLDIFDEKDVTTTWFLCGYWVTNCPDKVKELAKRGHVIGNHSDTHPHMSKLTSEEIAADLAAMDDRLEAVTGSRSAFFRPPYGEYDDNVVTTTRNNGLEVIQWDVDTVDWKDDATVDGIVDRVMSKVKSGSIILCHNNAKHVLEYMPIIIDGLKEKGFEFVTIPELLLPGKLDVDFTIDANGTQQAKGDAG